MSVFFISTRYQTSDCKRSGIIASIHAEKYGIDGTLKINYFTLIKGERIKVKRSHQSRGMVSSWDTSSQILVLA
jgi:hypothetical protein